MEGNVRHFLPGFPKFIGRILSAEKPGNGGKFLGDDKLTFALPTALNYPCSAGTHLGEDINKLVGKATDTLAGCINYERRTLAHLLTLTEYKDFQEQITEPKKKLLRDLLIRAFNGMENISWLWKGMKENTLKQNLTFDDLPNKKER